MIDKRHAKRPAELHSHNILANYLSFVFRQNLSTIRTLALTRFLSERKRRARVAALHRCIISDTTAKQNLGPQSSVICGQGTVSVSFVAFCKKRMFRQAAETNTRAAYAPQSSVLSAKSVVNFLSARGRRRSFQILAVRKELPRPRDISRRSHTREKLSCEQSGHSARMLQREGSQS